MGREEIAQGCLDQAEWAARLGSPMYEGLLRRMAEDVRAGGPCLAALEPHYGVLAHARAPAAPRRHLPYGLGGRLPEAVRFYPSTGGQADVDALWPHFLEAVLRAVLPVCVQTNEIGRSCALLPGFLEVARRTGLPLRLLEIGSSAGLNLRWNHFPFLNAPANIRVVERRGCDLNPIDPTLDDSHPAVLCFIWPDQTGRLKQLAEVIEIARRVPATVDQCDPSTGYRSTLPSRGSV